MAKSFSDRFVFYARESKMNGKEKRKTGERSRIEDLSSYYSQQGNERAREKHDVRISLLILHRVVSFLQL